MSLVQIPSCESYAVPAFKQCRVAPNAARRKYAQPVPKGIFVLSAA
jgi:hypothetical protein